MSNTLAIRFLNPSTKQLVSCNIPRNVTIKELIFHLVKEYELNSVNLELMTLCVAGTPTSEAIVLPESGKVDEQLSNLKEKDVLEMLRKPVMISVIYTENGTTPTELRRVLVELGSPLNDNFGRFRRCFAQLKQAEFVFQSVVPGEKPEWLNSNRSLRDYGFDANSQRVKALQLTLHSVISVTKRWQQIAEPVAKRGWLWKQSGADMDKLSPKREKRWFVLTRTFLAYFKTDNETFTPERVIPLDFHLLKRHRDENNPTHISICLRRVTKYFQVSAKTGIGISGISTDGSASEIAGRIAGSIGGTLRNVVKPTPNVYLLSTENFVEDPMWTDWFLALEEKCINTGDRKVFGVALADVLSRRSRGSLDTSLMVPPVITKTISYLDQRGLEYEGIFRLSGSANTIEMFKDEFDLGEDVDFYTCEDPHSVAGVLKHYLRALPEPLLTFDLYQSFLDAVAKKGSTLEQKIAEVSKLCSQLPLENKLVLRYLLTFFRRVTSMSHVNKMTPNNLAICMGTNLLRAPPQSSSGGPADVSQIITDTPLINDVAQILIEYESKMNLDVQLAPPPPASANSSTSPNLNPLPVRANVGARGAPPSPSVSGGPPKLPSRDTITREPAMSSTYTPSTEAGNVAALKSKLGQSMPSPSMTGTYTPGILPPSGNTSPTVEKQGTNPFTTSGGPPAAQRPKPAASAPLKRSPAPSVAATTSAEAEQALTSPPTPGGPQRRQGQNNLSSSTDFQARIEELETLVATEKTRSDKLEAIVRILLERVNTLEERLSGSNK